MATIIQREAQGAPSGYDQGLLLEYKEAFLYPLPSGLLDWSELRIAFRVGIYPNTGDWRTGNGWPQNLVTFGGNSTLTPAGDLKIGKIFFGLKNSNNYLMPFESGDSRYIGFGQSTGQRGHVFDSYFNNVLYPSRLLYYDSSANPQYINLVSITSGNTLGSRPSVYVLVNGTSNGAFAFPGPFESASSGRYSQMFALRYSKVGGTGFNFAIWKNFAGDSQSPAGTTYQTTEGLRSFMNSMNSADTSRYISFANFHYNNSGSESGSPIPLPDAIFAYMSMTGHRLIIYDFIAEKIS